MSNLERITAERVEVLIDSPNSQASIPKPGITREQVARYFKRYNAAVAAHALKYTDKTTAGSVIDSLIEEGATYESKHPYHALVTPNGTVTFNRKVEVDYIRTVLNLREFEKNYA